MRGGGEGTMKVYDGLGDLHEFLSLVLKVQVRRYESRSSSLLSLDFS